MKKSKNKKTSKKRFNFKSGRFIGVVVLVVVALLYGVGSGYLGYGVAYVRCGRQPVIASKFAAAYDYVLPGEKGYHPNVFSQYYCTQTEAETAGFHPQPGTVTAQDRRDALIKLKEREQQELLKKRDYIVYEPNMPGITYDKLRVGEVHGEIHTFYRLKKEGTVVADVRQGKVGSDYEVCHDKEYRCEVVAADTQGREITRQYSKNPKARTIVLGMHIGDTFINLSGDELGFTVDEAISILGSMKALQ